jgi:hypothetical protein
VVSVSIADPPGSGEFYRQRPEKAPIGRKLAWILAFLAFFYRQTLKTSDGKNSASLAGLPMTVNFIVKNSCLPPIVTDSL